MAGPPVVAGPLVARWLSCEIEPLRAGAFGSAVVEVENAGSATWRPGPVTGVNLGYHWLDDRGNPIVWDGERTILEGPVAPGERLRTTVWIRAPIPPGRYRLALDLVDERRLWFAEVGSPVHELEVEVGPRIARALAVLGGDPAALAAQEEPLVDGDEAEAVAFLADGCAPARDWSRRVLDAHQEGYAVVGGSIDASRVLGRRPRELAPWVPGPGRVPGFPHPLLCPSLVRGVDVEWGEPIAGLPAARPLGGEPWLYDGRIVITVRRRAGRRAG
jgi:hypothetical protein